MRLLLRRACQQLADRMNAKRKGVVHALGPFEADAREDAAKREHRVVQIYARARVEQRPAGRAARSPELADAVMIGVAEAVVERPIGQPA